MKIDSICKIERNVSFKTLTSIKAGGRIKYVAYPKSVDELKILLSFLEQNNIKHFVLGNGTNVLPPDHKYNGVIIKTGLLSRIYQRKNIIYAQAGANFSDLINFAIGRSLGGLERCYGIPGSAGGSIKGNSGVSGCEIGDFVQSVWVLRDGSIKKLSKSQCGFGYRKSGFLPSDVIVQASFAFLPSNKSELVAVRNQALQMRKAFPPYPSMGSVFKRAEGVVVSKMLDEMGFKGKRVGRAMVSNEHAGIIVNLGGAKSKNIKKLIKNIKKSVKNQKNIDLKEEIIYIR